VSSFIKKPEPPHFPDRTLAYAQAKQADEVKHLEALRVEEQAKIVQYTPKPQQAPQPVPTDAKGFIYMHESGNNPLAVNGAGCLGLGQACPGSKLQRVCPTLDYACEDAFFTNYAMSRYGSWEGAYQFWITHHWW